MKQIIVAFAMLFWFLGAFARVLEVRNDFRAGSFASIREAVENASANDTIFLVPKAGSNDPWAAKNVLIEKPLVFLGPQAGRLKIDGLMSVLLKNNVFTEFEISNIEMNQVGIVGESYTSQLNFSVKINNCKIAQLNMGSCNVQIFSSEINAIDASNCSFSKIIGSKINGTNSSYKGYNKVSDSLLVVGNILTGNHHLSYYAKQAIFLNNYITPDGSGNKIFDAINNCDKKVIVNNFFDFRSFSSSFFQISATDYQDSLYNLYLSNLFLINSNYGSNNYFYDCLFKNNLVVVSGVGENNFGSNFIPITSYFGNTQKNYNYANFNQAIGNQKASGGLVIVPDSLGQVFDSTYTINKGIAWPEFSDVDLTRNDIGPSGGPFPISNFWGAGAGKASLYWVDLPWKVLGGNTPIKIKATSGSK